MSDPFFIGTREKMLQVRAPSVGMPSAKSGWSSELEFLNGGTSLRRSVAAHKRYELSWENITRDQARPILDLADGIYGTGDIYFLDPFAANRNMLPQWWASPMQGIYDGLPLNGAATRGSAVITPTNTLDFPVQSIRYDTAVGTPRSIWIPKPVGYTIHVGAYGTVGTGGTVTVRPTTGPTTYAGPATALTLMDVASNSSRTNHTASGAIDGLEISLGGTGTVTLTGLIVQVLPDGQAVKPGPFISGQGHSGLRFAAQPEYTPYSYSFDTVGVVAELIEAGGWVS